MPIKINVKKSISEKAIRNYVLFSNEEFKVNSLNKLPLSKFSVNINQTINSNKSKNKDFILFNLNPSQKIIIVKLKDYQSSLSNERKGAKFFDFIKSNSILVCTFIEENFKIYMEKNKNFLDQFIHGSQLKSYEFKKYKTKKILKGMSLMFLIEVKTLDIIKTKDLSHLLMALLLQKILFLNQAMYYILMSMHKD